ncbi:hypothetical protein ACIRSU_02910 [Streptomyces sp. NPDC101160]|uniref:hypothetical protein n=1 Tax=Streptomyces sp. NPDC101160 TaxID=3366118 RepID=UPI003812107A
MAALLLLPLAAGCAAASGPSRDTVRPPTSASPLRLAAGEAPVLPLDRLFWSDQEYATLHAALDVLTRRCMEQARLPMPPGSRRPMARGPRAAHRYGIIDDAEAKRYGYHGAPLPPPPPAPRLSTAQLAALTGTQPGRPSPRGVPAEGCNGWAARQITGTTSYPVDHETVRRLDSESFELSLKDPRTRRVIAAWVDCMEAADATHAASPDQKPPALRGTEPTAEEIRTARVDVACKEKTGLVGLWAGVESAYQQQMLRDGASAVQDIERERRQQLKAAARALQGGSR